MERLVCSVHYPTQRRKRDSGSPILPIMYEGWDLDPPTVEEEIFKKENEEADLKRKRFNWLSHDNRGKNFLDA